MPSQKFDPKAQPPSFTALQQHTADNYHALAEAMGLLPDGITVDELIKRARQDREFIRIAEEGLGELERLAAQVEQLQQERDALRKRADGYEAAVAEIAEILEQPAPVWTEGSELWALSLWQGVSRLKEDLKLAQANESVAALNEESLAQFHEAVENETRDKFQVKAAKWKYRALKSQRLIRQLQADLELHRATYEYATTGLLSDYDRLTLALSYKWGDAKKKQFLKDIEDDTFMAKLEARWERKFPEESGERSEA